MISKTFCAASSSTQYHPPCTCAYRCKFSKRSPRSACKADRADWFPFKGDIGTVVCSFFSPHLPSLASKWSKCQQAKLHRWFWFTWWVCHSTLNILNWVIILQFFCFWFFPCIIQSRLLYVSITVVVGHFQGELPNYYPSPVKVCNIRPIMKIQAGARFREFCFRPWKVKLPKTASDRSLWC
jgi:hypothetical protein